MNERHEFHLLGEELTFDPAAVLPGDEEHRAPCINSLALDVSGSCNLGCAYCAESATLPDRGKMPQWLIDLAIDRLFDWSAPFAPVSIHLGSGEPLLQFVKQWLPWDEKPENWPGTKIAGSHSI